MRLLRVVVSIALPLSACASTSETGNQPEKQASTFTISGTVRFLNVEGGCWYIETPDGTRYEPSGEDLQRILVDGLSVELEVRWMKNVFSVCQTGKPVEVLSILKTMERDN
jgi:hypothetical protein